MDGKMSLLTSPFVPEGMVDLMKKLSKSVIKERPPNIYQFAADFFEKMLIERDGSLDKGYGKFRSYTEYCKFMDKMDKRRLSQPKHETVNTINATDSANASSPPAETAPLNITIQGVAIQGVERKSKDSVKNVSINPKYKTQSEQVMKPVVSSVKNVKTKPRKLSSKKPSENLIVIKEETSADVDDNGGNEGSNLHRAAATIQTAFRKYLGTKNAKDENSGEASVEVSRLSENAAALIIQKAFKSLIRKLKVPLSIDETIDRESNKNVAGQENEIYKDKITNNNDENSEQILLEYAPEKAVSKALEPTENRRENALQNTAVTPDRELNENQLENNLDDVTPNDFVTTENQDQKGLASVNTAKGSGDQNKISSQEKEEKFASDGLPSTDGVIEQSILTENQSDEDTNTKTYSENASVEVSLIEVIDQSAENILDEPSEIESVANQLVASRSNQIESSENQAENLSEDTAAHGTDSQVESEPNIITNISEDTLSQPDTENKEDQLLSEATPQLDKEIEEKQQENALDDAESNNVRIHELKPENCESTALGQTTDAESNVNHHIVEEVEDAVQSQKEHSQSQIVETIPAEIDTESAIDPFDNNYSDGKLISPEVQLEKAADESLLEAKQSEQIETLEQSKPNDQLFLVENDGIYVNLNVLQDKLDQIAVDDGTGGEDEKSFKLNILEREEILVNQENIQQIADDPFEASDNNNESSDYAEVKSGLTDIESKNEENVQRVGDDHLLVATDAAVDNNDKLSDCEAVKREVTDFERVENVQLFGDDHLVTATEVAVDNNNESSNCATVKREVTDFEGMENAENKVNLQSKEEEGNEEYELAETVVLGGTPLRRTPDDESVGADPETDKDGAYATHVNEEIIDVAAKSQKSVTSSEPSIFEPSKLVQNKQDNIELDKLESNVIKLEPTDSVASTDHQVKGDYLEDRPTKPLSEDVLMNEEMKAEPENVNEQLPQEPLSEDVLMNEETKAEPEKFKEQLQQKSIDASSISSEKTTDIDPIDDKGASSEEKYVGKLVKNPGEEELLMDDQLSDNVANKDVVIMVDEPGENQQVEYEIIMVDATGPVDPLKIQESDVIEKIESKNDDAKVIDLAKPDAVNDCTTDLQSQSHADELFKINENEKLVQAATAIQKVFRGYIVRRSTKIKTNDDNNQVELSAALIIQKYVRGYLVRRLLNKSSNSNIVRVTSHHKEDAQITEASTNTELVPQLPNYSNRFLIPKDSFLERSFADDEDYAKTCKELAATSIQKTYRGYRVRRSLKPSSDSSDDVLNETDNGKEIADSSKNENEFSNGDNDVRCVETEAQRVISAVLSVASDVLPLQTQDSGPFTESVTDLEDTTVDSLVVTQEKSSIPQANPSEPLQEDDSVLGQLVHDNIHVEGQMQQKFNQMSFKDSAINPIEETSDSSEHPDTPGPNTTRTAVKGVDTLESVESKFDDVKSFSYEQLSSDFSDTDENKRESLKESDETSRDDLSEVENFDLSSCEENSLEAMYYSIRKNEILLDKMQKQVVGQRESKTDEVASVESDNFKMEFPERVTENLDEVMKQVFKSVESSSDCDGGRKDEDDNSTTLDLVLDDSSSINDEKEIETSRHIKQLEEINFEHDEGSESTIDNFTQDNEQINQSSLYIDDSQSSEANFVKHLESNNDQSQSDSSVNSSTRFIMKSQSVSEDMMNPMMFAMKRKQALLDQLHVRPYPLHENLSEDHDAFPEHLLSDIDIGNIQRKIFASSVSETDSDYIESCNTNRRLVRDDFNISTALDHLSTDSDSTIVSAATKIQAGARGFLTRRRLRRSSAGGTSMSFEKRYSFGNAAIDKSLEDLIKRQEQINLDGAALKIQQQYRRYQARKKNLKKVSPIREQTLELSGGSSVEGTEDDNIGIREITMAQKKTDISADDVSEKLTTSNECNVEDCNADSAQPIKLNIDEVDTVLPVKTTPVNQRRLTLQRGDAVQRNSRPDSPDQNVRDQTQTVTGNRSNEKLKDSETGEYTGSIISKPEKKVTPNINIQSLINRGIGPRQRSMPVQIDSELMRIIPKHLRKRVKSADIAKKKSC